MSRVYQVTICIFQAGCTFFILLGIYMFLAILDYQGGIDGFIGLTFFQIFLGSFFSLVTVAIFSVMGLPIRMKAKVYSWWVEHYYISIVGVILGWLILLLAFIPAFSTEVPLYSEEGLKEEMRNIPNNALIMIGWSFIGFFTLHLFPPDFLIKKLGTVIESARSPK